MRMHPSITLVRVENAIARHQTTLGNPGLCVRCGADAEGVEPDARRCDCELCGEPGAFRCRGAFHSAGEPLIARQKLPRSAYSQALPMVATVFTMAETADRTGFVLGVFATLDLALDVARSWALRRMKRCEDMDRKSLSITTATNSYRLNVIANADDADISIIHSPGGEADLVRWQVRRFDVIEPPPLSHATGFPARPYAAVRTR